MKFNMSQAWNDATAMFSANREVLLVVAGIFFLLPGLLTAVVFADEQAEAMAVMQKMMTGGQLDPAEMPEFGGGFALASLALTLFQLVGMMALLALLNDAKRPTVGEAIAIAVRLLPSLIGVSIIYVIGYFVVIMGGALILGGLAAAVGAGVLAAILAIPFIAVIFYLMTKFSLTLAVLVLERQFNPIKALAGSWKLTKGNSVRLFGFYFLLMVVYIVISLLISGLFMSLIFMIVGNGTLGIFLLGIISGSISAVVITIFVAILAAIHRQLSGPSAAAVSELFE